MTSELLEQRLRGLVVSGPDVDKVMHRVLSSRAAHRRRVPSWPGMALAPVAIVLITALIAYFVPAADTALASRVPWSGEILRWAGLVGVSDRITWVRADSTSSGYTLSLTGIYADSTRTVLLMHSDPAIAAPAAEPVLTDQFARTYHVTGSTSNLDTGDLVMTFEPLAWPDSMTGARITLHVTELQTPANRQVDGRWELTATTGIDVARDLEVPPPATLGPAHFRFTAVKYTPATIEVELEVTGVSAEDLYRLVPVAGEKGGPALEVDLIDPQGRPITGSSSSSGDENSTSIEVFGFRTAGAGTYLVRVSYHGYGSFERAFVIP